MPALPQYIVRPRADWSDDAPTITGQIIVQEDDSPIDTGLLDAQGAKIFRVRDKLPIGYIS